MAKVLVSIDDKVLARIDREVKARGTTRSAYIQGLAERAMERRGPGRDPKVRHAIQRLQELFAKYPSTEDPVAALRAEREARLDRRSP